MFFLTVLACIAFSQVHSQYLYDGHYHARPYQAGYYIREPHRHQHAEVTRDHGGAVAGRYGYLDARGIGRQVNYVADHAPDSGLASTNEPAAVLSTAVAAVATDDVAAWKWL
ncbi:hypothetical protein AVEN_242551-1 [Araneus ventricosus]|uniref:Cuticle protein 16.8 n=1 Tax=Araneus ventricosus TaxID=182803 RepID=A0A4Y2W268_ARAVE|nr:hypothetical protein AVEN_242551-1 [Araneus ventricosus]